VCLTSKSCDAIIDCSRQAPCDLSDPASCSAPETCGPVLSQNIDSVESAKQFAAAGCEGSCVESCIASPEASVLDAPQ
jgi:hypothetical protein